MGGATILVADERAPGEPVIAHLLQAIERLGFRPETATSMERALEVALDLVKALVPLIAKVGRHSRKEAAQLEDAANSVVRSLAEGRRRNGKDRSYLWTVAAGSADEVRWSLRLSLAHGWLEDADVLDAMALGDRVLAMTWRLTH